MFKGITEGLLSGAGLATACPERSGFESHQGDPVAMAAGVCAESAPPQTSLITVGICDTQPVAVAGLRAILAESEEFELSWATDSLAAALQLARATPPRLLIIDKGFGQQTVLDTILDLRSADIPTVAVVWGISVTEAEALRFLQSGARGILRKTSSLHTVLSCLRAVGSGSSWMEEHVLRDSLRSQRGGHSELTPREQQVLELVEQGLKNKEIAQELGIRPGTVKIHLKHIFEKTGVRGRYGLALASLKERTSAS